MRDFAKIERLVRFDVEDAYISERMWRHLVSNIRSNHIRGMSEEIKALAAIRRALGFRFLMAVQRTLQGRCGNKANLEALLWAAKNHINNKDFIVYERSLTLIRESPGARSLQQGRNIFLAHTVIHSRDGSERIIIDDVLSILFQITDFIDSLHGRIFHDKIYSDEKYQLYSRISQNFWGKVLSRMKSNGTNQFECTP